MNDEELRQVMADHVDYYETVIIECEDCHQEWPAVWSDFAPEDRLDADNPWRLAAEHWITVHSAGSTSLQTDQK